MKRLFVISLVILNMIVFCATNGSSTKANIHSSTRAAKFTAMPTSLAVESDLDFTLVNKTGYAIHELYVSPSKSDDWDEDVLGQDRLENGQSLELKFNKNAKATKWDIRVVWSDEYPDTVWYDLKLTEINTVTLTYNRKSGETHALLD